MNAELVEFTRRALAAGKERKEISDILRRAGWAEPDIEAALDAFADITFPIPVPRPKPYLSAPISHRRERVPVVMLRSAVRKSCRIASAVAPDEENDVAPDWSA
jgi:hypothetical protein